MIAPLAASALVVLALPSVSASCGYGLSWVHPKEDFTVNITGFTYGTLTGPENWHHLSSDNYLCANGTSVRFYFTHRERGLKYDQQSPILISSTNDTTVPAGTVQLYVPNATNVTFENINTNVQINLENGTMLASGGNWTLVQFHWHSASEHRIDLLHYEAEMHFVFAAADGSKKAAVLGYLLEANDTASTPLLETIFAQLPAIQTPGTATSLPSLDFSSFSQMVASQSHYTYNGSLTTPPCTEGVLWYVGTQPIPLNLTSYLALRNTVKSNNRFTQSFDGYNRSADILVVAAAGLS